MIQGSSDKGHLLGARIETAAGSLFARRGKAPDAAWVVLGAGHQEAAGDESAPHVPHSDDGVHHDRQVRRRYRSLGP